MTRQTLAAWQLGVLAALHFTVDMLSGTLPGFLPVLRERYSLSLTVGSMLVSLCAFSSNSVQLLVGNLRKSAVRPRLIQTGVILSALICFVGLIPPGTGATLLLSILMLVVGTGVALLHPEGLRGVCAVDAVSISPGVATSLFMLSGFLGYATGPLLGSWLVERSGFTGLFWLVVWIAPLLWLFQRFRVRLAVEESAGSHAPRNNNPRSAARSAPTSPLTFREVFLVATLINTGCIVIQALLPTYLNGFHFSLIFGGASAMLFGAGAGLGAFATSFVVRRHPTLRVIQLEILAGVPLLLLYLLLARHREAIFLVFFAGALVGAGFPQLVVLARSAANGPSLGARMGLIVGGTWGIAGVVLLGVGALGDAVGLTPAMLTSPFFFLLVPIFCRKLRRRRQHPSNTEREIIR